MSKALRHARHMRIIALPLTNGSSSSTSSSVYYRFQTPPPPPSNTPPSLFKKATDKTAELWASFGNAPEGSWKQRTFHFGERIMDRIEFEELALKSMDPSLGPDLSHWRNTKSKPDEKLDSEEPVIPLIHPTSLAPFDKLTPLEHFRSLLLKRTPRHKRGFYTWMLVSPLMAPFAIVPIVPNLPFFFCVWRSWHHYKAYKASEYLESLVERGAILPEPSIALDGIYTANPPKYTHTTDDLADKERVLLSKDAIPKIVDTFELPPSAAADLLRALDQTHTRLKVASQ